MKNHYGVRRGVGHDIDRPGRVSGGGLCRRYHEHADTRGERSAKMKQGRLGLLRAHQQPPWNLIDRETWPDTRYWTTQDFVRRQQSGGTSQFLLRLDRTRAIQRA